eukprot:XP_001708274.1 Hypothetical protein GL50803_109264 [Giardia lamblia ATCC 50803]
MDKQGTGVDHTILADDQSDYVMRIQPLTEMEMHRRLSHVG